MQEPEDLYPTPGPSAHRLPQLLDEDVIMEDEREGSSTETEISNGGKVDDSPTDRHDGTSTNPSITLVQEQKDLDADEDQPELVDKDDEDYEEEVEEDEQPRMPKAGWSEDTVQTETMAQLGICINTVARVIVCIQCAAVVKPLELPGHLAKSHPPILTSAEFSQELANTYDLRGNVETRPGFIITAIYGLPLIGGYLTCDTCGYACKSEKTMWRHTRQHEGCKTSRTRPVQTFRPSSKRHHFGVSLEPQHAEESTSAALDPLTYLKSKFAPTPFSDVPIKSPESARDANHFLNLEKWDLYVQGSTGAEIMEVAREREPQLRDEVRTCVERFAADVTMKLGKVDHEVRAAMADYLG